MDMFLRRALERLIEIGALDVVGSDGRTYAFGDRRQADPTLIRFADAAAERDLLLDPELRLGELYMDGRLIVERGSIYDFLLLLLKNARPTRMPAAARLLANIRGAMGRRGNGLRRAASNAAHHYDIDERLYRLFLDADLQYSCAYFDTPDMDLENAQRAKKRHIAAKLLVEPGQSVLDIGCGWGGMALYLADVARAGDVLGVTLSGEQARVANARALDAGLAGKVEIGLMDYRKVAGAFDRIVSVGMFEHVGRANYDEYFETCRDLLADDGVMVLHTIVSSHGPAPPSPWIEKYIFPGGELPAVSEIAAAVERNGLFVTDVELLRLHYAETLRHWRARFNANRQEAEAIYDARFCRMWEFYLAASEAVFRTGRAMVAHVQIAKRLDTVPWTRDYIAQREAALRRAEKDLVRASGRDLVEGERAAKMHPVG